jgi:hypothetical protein
MSAVLMEYSKSNRIIMEVKVNKSRLFQEVIVTRFAEKLHSRSCQTNINVYTINVKYALTQPDCLGQVALLYKLLFYCNEYCPDRTLVYGMLMAWMHFGTAGVLRKRVRSGHTSAQIDALIIEAAHLLLGNNEQPAFCCYLEKQYTSCPLLLSEPVMKDMIQRMKLTLLSDNLKLKLGISTDSGGLSDLAWFMPKEKKQKNNWFARTVAKTLTHEHCMRFYRHTIQRLRANTTKPSSRYGPGFPKKFLLQDLEVYYWAEHDVRIHVTDHRVSAAETARESASASASTVEENVPEYDEEQEVDEEQKVDEEGEDGDVDEGEEGEEKFNNLDCILEEDENNTNNNEDENEDSSECDELLEEEDDLTDSFPPPPKTWLQWFFNT